MRLHSDPIDQLLLLLDESVFRVAANLVYFSHVYPLLRLPDRLLCESEHLLEGLHSENELGWLWSSLDWDQIRLDCFAARRTARSGATGTPGVRPTVA